MDGQTSTPATSPKKRAWFQVRLSSLLAGQLIVCLLFYLNTNPHTGIRWRQWYGFPVLAFRPGDEIYWKDPAVLANCFIWITLVIGTCIGLELFYRIRSNGISYLKPRFFVATYLYFITSLMAVPIIWVTQSDYITYETPLQPCGWPFEFFFDNGSIRLLRCLICDIYIALAWIVPTTLLLEWYLRRCYRLKSQPQAT